MNLDFFRGDSLLFLELSLVLETVFLNTDSLVLLGEIYTVTFLVFFYLTVCGIRIGGLASFGMPLVVDSLSSDPSLLWQIVLFYPILFYLHPLLADPLLADYPYISIGANYVGLSFLDLYVDETLGGVSYLELVLLDAFLVV